MGSEGELKNKGSYTIIIIKEKHIADIDFADWFIVSTTLNSQGMIKMFYFVPFFFYIFELYIREFNFLKSVKMNTCFSCKYAPYFVHIRFASCSVIIS